MSEEKVEEKKMMQEEKKNDNDDQKKNEGRGEEEIENVVRIDPRIDPKKDVEKDGTNTEAQEEKKFEEHKRREKIRIQEEADTIKSIMSDHSHCKKALQARIGKYIVGVIHEGMDRIGLQTNLGKKYSIATHDIAGDWFTEGSTVISVLLFYSQDEPKTDLEEED